VIVSFGIKTLLLLLALLLFMLAVISEKDFENLLAWGLAAVTASFLLADIGWDRKYGRNMGSRSHNS
jgi:hypothetical protein